MMRKTVRRGVGIALLVLVAAGVWAGFNRNELRTKYVAHRFVSASSDDDRARWADALAERDDGPRRLLAICRTGAPDVRSAAAAALVRHLESLPPSDSRGTDLAATLLDAFASGSDADRDSLAALLPVAVLRGGAVHTELSRSAILTGLNHPGVEVRVPAIRAALSPDIHLRAEVVPLLRAPEAEVRRAALFAVGPATEDEAVLGDEDLFHWLHDTDADVRTICRAALVSRGRTDAEITLGGRLVDPSASERLKLLFDLRYDDDLHDPEPWLERLSHDSDPGVRAGSARVMMELNGERMLPPPAWVTRLAESDPEPAVRRIAHYYRSQPPGRPDPGVRLVDGP